MGGGVWTVDPDTAARQSQGMSDTLLSRFLRYVQMDTQSNEMNPSCPSTPGQLELQRMLQR